MHFLAPAAFWFAATIPVVVLFYLLKRKRVVKLVSSTMLWQRFLSDTQASAPFQKLRKNWLLLLQFLLLPGRSGPVAALFCRQSQTGRVARGYPRCLGFDAGTDEAPSRFEKARAEALKWVDSLAGSDQMVILLAGANAEVKQSATARRPRCAAPCRPALLGFLLPACSRP